MQEHGQLKAKRCDKQRLGVALAPCWAAAWGEGDGEASQGARWTTWFKEPGAESAGDLVGCSGQAAALERRDTERGPQKAAEGPLQATHKQGNDLRPGRINTHPHLPLHPPKVEGLERGLHMMAIVALPTSQTGKLLMQGAPSTRL